MLRAYSGNPGKFRTFAAFYNQLMLEEETCMAHGLEMIPNREYHGMSR